MLGVLVWKRLRDLVCRWREGGEVSGRWFVYQDEPNTGDLVNSLATRRADLTDEQWVAIEPLLPVGKKSGRPPKWTKRQLIDGIRWRIRVGSPWRDVPACYGSWESVYGLFRRWQRAGVWAGILSALQGLADAEGRITWDVGVDSTIARAHQHAAGARKRGICRSSRRVSGMIPSPAIMGWAALGAGGPRRRIWRASRAESRCLW